MGTLDQPPVCQRLQIRTDCDFRDLKTAAQIRHCHLPLPVHQVENRLAAFLHKHVGLPLSVSYDLLSIAFIIDCNESVVNLAFDP